MKFPLFFLSLLVTISVNAQKEHLKKAAKAYENAVLFESKNIDSSLVYTEKAYKILKNKDTINTVFTDVLNQYGRIYFFKQEYQKAYNYFNRCSAISLVMGQEEAAYKVKINMAVCQRELNNTKIALENLFDVVAYYEKKDPKNINLGKTYVNIADLYMLNKQHAFAEKHYTKGASFFEPGTNIYVQLQGNRIANFNAFDLKKSLSIIQNIEATTNLDSLPVSVSTTIYNSMAQTMVKTDQLDKGLFYTLKGLNLKKKSGLTKSIAIQYNNVGDIYIKSKQYPLAIAYLDSALETAVTNRQRFQILKNLQKAHKANQDIEKSLQYANQYIVLKDSMNEVLTQKEIAELGIKYESHKQNQFINKLQNLSTLYKVIIALIAFVALFIIILMFKKNKSVGIEVKELQEELTVFKNKQQKKQTPASEMIQLKSKAVIDCNTILYIKSDAHYVEYYLDSKTTPEVDRNKLSAVLEVLPTASFIRIHKSYIVNINRIKIINSTKVMLDNGEWINLSRTYKQELKDILHKE